MQQDKITVIINTSNEEKNIVDCLRTARILTKKIVVVDMESKDKTVELAKKFNAKVYSFQPSLYVEPARMYAISKSETDWVFVLDADERITKELANEIKEKLDKDTLVTHYETPRKNIFAKTRWLKYGGWWPDYQIRMINKKFFVEWPKKIHSTPMLNGEKGRLTNSIEHYFHGSLDKMVDKTVIFEDIESDLLFKAKRDASTATFFRKFVAELWRRLFRNLGFMDGTFGIIESIYQAYSKTITYLFLYEKKIKNRSL
ncbi:hypothetical protein B6D29_03470 [Microgenomates bacterium UTCPR1]|nr:glycosyltransferase family 2 protein [Patescibacteria group bacterium]OQY65862.1 MAG: hypothetical protein B6D29_03470 [Microgenomates bacterium UTCPR1]